MKINKYIAISLVIIIIFVSGFSFFKFKEDKYIRVHIRANGNSTYDQTVKYIVRDKLLDYLTPLLKDAEKAKDAKKIIKENLKNIEVLANYTLYTEGLKYSAKVSFKKEKFPRKEYGDLVLKEGVYRAIIIDLGRSEGDNWWCVAFPPLCFIPVDSVKQGEEDKIEYKSKIIEIIKKIFGL